MPRVFRHCVLTWLLGACHELLALHYCALFDQTILLQLAVSLDSLEVHVLLIEIVSLRQLRKHIFNARRYSDILSFVRVLLPLESFGSPKLHVIAVLGLSPLH